MPLIHGSVTEFLKKFTEGERAVAKENFALVITTEESNEEIFFNGPFN